MEGKKRLTYIDWAKGIAISLIVAGHFLPGGCYPKVLMYSFHVPIFALLGGMLTKPADSFKAYGKKMGALSLRLLVPYTIWFILFSIPYSYPIEEIPKVVKTQLEFKEIFKRYFFLENESIWNAQCGFYPRITSFPCLEICI